MSWKWGWSTASTSFSPSAAVLMMLLSCLRRGSMQTTRPRFCGLGGDALAELDQLLERPIPGEAVGDVAGAGAAEHDQLDPEANHPIEGRCARTAAAARG